MLHLSVIRADILSDGTGTGTEMAEIEALLEEAAELVDESQPKNPNYCRYLFYQIFPSLIERKMILNLSVIFLVICVVKKKYRLPRRLNRD